MTVRHKTRNLFLVFVTASLIFILYVQNAAYECGNICSVHQTKLERNQSQTTIRSTLIDHVFIGVRSSAKFHSSRLQLLLDTWISTTSPGNVYVTTDTDAPFIDESYLEHVNSSLGGHLIVTNCMGDHERQGLCCKYQKLLNLFWLQSDKQWFCHFDDDTYLHIGHLLDMLATKPFDQFWYIGKPSLNHPLEITVVNGTPTKQPIEFWFSTGGAGTCLSRSLIGHLAKHFLGSAFIDHCESIRVPDDCTMGYIVSHFGGVELTVEPRMHSHLERLSAIGSHTLQTHVTLSYSPSEKPGTPVNRINMAELKGHKRRLNFSRDSTGFYSLHCWFYPNASICDKIR